MPNTISNGAWQEEEARREINLKGKKTQGKDYCRIRDLSRQIGRGEGEGPQREMLSMRGGRS